MFHEVISIRDLPAMVRSDTVSFSIIRLSIIRAKVSREGLMGTAKVLTREGPVFVASRLRDGVP